MHSPMVLLALLASTLAIRVADAAVTHVPPAEATAGEEVELVADAPTTTPTLVVHFRAHGATAAFSTAELVRKGGTQWVAVLPAASIVAPGVDYYITAGDQPAFASPTWPHRMPVTVTASADRRSRDLVRAGGKRSRIHSQFEWVNFGTTKDGNVSVYDRYYRFDADFSYRLLAYPLEELRVGYTRLIGDVNDACGQPACADKGFKVGGWFELGLGPVEGVRFDGRVMVMATQAGFALGGRLEGRLGSRDASHIALGIETLADVGHSGFFRLGWGTVPRTPMAATVEISHLPSDDRAAGVRLVYDIARELGSGVRLGVRIGYAARNQNVAGITGGGNVVVDF
ncbi:MAG: hypothetical protein SFX73_24510 [Kofleriaceae bacterium]|nr:hypothetical protein [Kofleriaceae bacterium]